MYIIVGEIVGVFYTLYVLVKHPTLLPETNSDIHWILSSGSVTKVVTRHTNLVVNLPFLRPDWRNFQAEVEKHPRSVWNERCKNWQKLNLILNRKH